MKRILARFSLFACCLAGFVSSGAVAAPTAIDPTTQGPFTAVASEYKLPAKVDPEVTSAIETELWARVFYPTGTGVPQSLPLVIMLHGEHGTCGKLDSTGKWYIDDRADYTFTGTCPAGYRVTPNHWGYDYIGSVLASNGYVVISINTNRGINQAPEVDSENDRGNIQRRGRMILRHLEQLGVWNAQGHTPKSVGFEFKGRLDFKRITLVGHSRGAEAIASAIALYFENGSPWPDRLPGRTKFLGLAAIAPSDFQTSSNPGSTFGRAYGVLLPMCDGDVSRLVGIHYYDVAVGFALDGPGNFKSSFATWGTDHDAYNTEWHTQDAWNFATDQPNTQTCPGQGGTLFPTLGTSNKQQQIGRRFVMSIVRGVTESPNYAQLLNPAYDVPASIASTTRYDRGYFPGQLSGHGMRLMQFAGNGNCKTELFTTQGSVGSCGRAPEHDQLLTWIARVRWGAPAGSTPTDQNFAHFIFNDGATFDLSTSKTLEFRMGPDCVPDQPSNGSFTDYGCKKKTQQDPSSDGSQGVYALLADANGNFSQYVWLGQYTELRQAVAINEVPQVSTLINPLYHALMSSVRVPIADFQAQAPFDMTKVRSIWFFLGYHDSSGGLFVGDIMATDADTLSGARRTPRPSEMPPLPPASLALRAGHDSTAAAAPRRATEQAPLSAVPGNKIVAVRSTSRPVPGAVGKVRQAMVAVTVKTPRPMIEANGGFRAMVGSASVDARYVGSSPDRRKTTLLIPRSAVASAGAGLSVISGGSRWDFGAMPSIQP